MTNIWTKEEESVSRLFGIWRPVIQYGYIRAKHILSAYKKKKKKKKDEEEEEEEEEEEKTER